MMVMRRQCSKIKGTGSWSGYDQCGTQWGRRAWGSCAESPVRHKLQTAEQEKKMAWGWTFSRLNNKNILHWKCYEQHRTEHSRLVRAGAVDSEAQWVFSWSMKLYCYLEMTMIVGFRWDVKSGAEWMPAPLAHPVQDTYDKKLAEFLNFTFTEFA